MTYSSARPRPGITATRFVPLCPRCVNACLYAASSRPPPLSPRPRRRSCRTRYVCAMSEPGVPLSRPATFLAASLLTTVRRPLWACAAALSMAEGVIAWAGRARSSGSRRMIRMAIAYRPRGGRRKLPRCVARGLAAERERGVRARMLTLHHLNNSRSQRILWLLEELGTPYEMVKYQRMAPIPLAPPELREVHPLGKSPVITDGGKTIAESGAI